MTKTNSSRTDELSAEDQLHRDLATAIVTFHEAVARRLGVTAADQRVLGVLGRLGVATPSRLAEATGLTTGAITGIVDRLERAGFAKRAPNPADRRSILVHACNAEALGKVMGPIFAALSAEMAALRGRYTPDQLAAIYAYLGETTEILRAQTRAVASADGKRKKKR
ncbi:MAG: MarR family transcriptional regulator [Sphingomonadaceae bacterium]|nr:MarR family transcriptional regulator [Sphingomonadaceae bacterium]